MSIVGFLQRFLSSDFRRAVAAEGAGDYAEAARFYALCGEREKVAEMHLHRAGKSTSGSEEIDCLRDAIRWADAGTLTRRRIVKALGLALMARIKRGPAGEKERAQVKEAAVYLVEAGDFLAAGAAWELIGDDANAARAYELGGLVEKMEDALQRDERKRRAAQKLRSAFEDYELHMKGGDREAALAALRLAVDAADSKGEYRRLLDDLVARRLADETVTLRGSEGRVVVCGASVVTLGRSPDCHLSLRSGSVSRVHAEVAMAADGYTLRDAGSRGGTWVGGLPLAGEVKLAGEGRFTLGSDCEIAYRAGDTLELRVTAGLDSGLVLLHAAPETRVDLGAPLGVRAAMWFRAGRPYLEASGDALVYLNGARSVGPVQLVRRDVLVVDEVEIAVE